VARSHGVQIALLIVSSALACTTYGERVEVAPDAGSDAGGSAIDAGVPFCAKPPQSTILCDDFTDGTFGKWTRSTTGTGGIDPNNTLFISPPRAVEIHVGANTASNAASITQTLAFSKDATFVRVEVDIRVEERTKLVIDVQMLRLDSAGVPLVLVSRKDDFTFYTQSNMAFTTVGNPFRIVEKTFSHLVVELRRVAGAGAAFAATVEGVKISEGQIDQFDPPLTLRLGATAAEDIGTRVIFDNLLVTVD
jgi:hypothetical protein